MQNPATKTPVIWSVGSLTREIKQLLEENFDRITVQGEISQPKISRNGHLYFTLKDEEAQLACVMWQSQRNLVDQPIEHGQEVVVSGPIQLYAPHGRYQLIVQSLYETGVGALQQAFEKLKKKLETEGLFDPSRKRPLPAFPSVIGVVTSATGAAFQDMKNTLEKRFPLCKILLFHASVQGTLAATEIVEGIRFFSREKNIDLLIIGRGGGSLEDLQAFNDEMVARAVAESPVPVISAVGHETDFSITDFVADVRAATPTQAIILAVPDGNDIRMKLDDIQLTVEKRVFDIFAKYRQVVSGFLDNYALHKVKQRIDRQKEYINWQTDRIDQTLKNRLHRYHETLQRNRDSIHHTTARLLVNGHSRWVALHHQLQAADPNAPLKKGYTRILQDGTWIRQSRDFESDRDFQIAWSDRKTNIKPKRSG